MTFALAVLPVVPAPPGFPVVATSGNLTDEPIAIDDREALERLAGIADRFLLHDRPIARHVDDSVAWFVGGAPQVLRRARGYAPLLEALVPHLRARGIACTSEELILTTGSQQAVDLVTRLFVDPGDVVLVELPTFTGAIADVLGRKRVITAGHYSLKAWVSAHVYLGLSLTVLATLHTLRQQNRKAPGQPNYALADYVAPIVASANAAMTAIGQAPAALADNGHARGTNGAGKATAASRADFVGAFAVTTGIRVGVNRLPILTMKRMKA